MATMIPQSGGSGGGVEHEYIHPDNLVDVIDDNGSPSLGATSNFEKTYSKWRYRLYDTYVNYDNPERYLTVEGGYSILSGWYRERVAMLIINPKGQKDVFKRIISTTYTTRPDQDTSYGTCWATTFGDSSALAKTQIIVNSLLFDTPQIVGVNIFNDDTAITGARTVNFYMPLSSATYNNRMRKKTVSIPSPSSAGTGLTNMFVGVISSQNSYCIYIEETDTLYIPIMYANGTGSGNTGTNKVRACIYKVENIISKMVNNESLSISLFYQTPVLDRSGSAGAYTANRYLVRYSVRRNNIVSICMGLSSNGNGAETPIIIFNINLDTNECSYVSKASTINAGLSNYMFTGTPESCYWIKNRLYQCSSTNGAYPFSKASSPLPKSIRYFSNEYRFNDWDFTTGEAPNSTTTQYEYEFDSNTEAIFGTQYTDSQNCLNPVVVLKGLDICGIYFEYNRYASAQNYQNQNEIRVNYQNMVHNYIKNAIKPIKRIEATT